MIPFQYPYKKKALETPEHDEAISAAKPRGIARSCRREGYEEAAEAARSATFKGGC